MNNVYAMGWNIESVDRPIMERVVKGCLGIIPSIKDITSDDYNLADADLIITFGKEAFEAMWGTRHPLVAVPEPKDLVNLPINEEARQYTFEKLTEAKQKYIDKSGPPAQINSLTKESLPAITANDVAQLEKQNPNGWVGKTKNGKTIRLSAKPTEGSEDINLTFAELYALKIATELLDVTEFTLVTANQSHSRTGS